MGRKHAVKQGEDLVSIARKYGISANKLKGHGPNEALWSATRDEEILRPGDELEVPDIEPRTETAPSDARTRFRAKFAGKAEIRLRLADIDGPRANLDYEIAAGSVVVEGKTDGDGILQVEVPIDTQSATLRIIETGEEYKIQVAHLDPPGTVSGAQQRLRNLGYFFGAIDDKGSPELEQAIRRFQQDNEMENTGEYTDATRDKLVGNHGC